MQQISFRDKNNSVPIRSNLQGPSQDTYGIALEGKVWWAFNQIVYMQNSWCMHR